MPALLALFCGKYEAIHATTEQLGLSTPRPCSPLNPKLAVILPSRLRVFSAFLVAVHLIGDRHLLRAQGHLPLTSQRPGE